MRNSQLLQRAFGFLPSAIQKFLIRSKHKRFNVKSYLGISGLTDSPEVVSTIVVLGMHRSGTSLVGEVLSRAGVNLGKEHLRPEVENPRGFFENKIFVKLNDKILALAGGSWDSPPPHDRIVSLKNKKCLLEEIGLAVRSQQDQIWGWKDPRSVLTMDLFFPFLKNPRIIHCIRDGASVAKSLNRRNQMPLEEGVGLARYYEDQISQFLQRNRLPAITVQYEDLLEHPEEQIARILGFLGIDKKIDFQIVDRNLKHF